MDESRRNFLAYQTVSGVKFVTIKDSRYKIIAPSKELRLLAEHVYQETMHSLRFDTLITRERASLLLRGLNIWAPQHDEDLKGLEKHLDNKKVDLYHALYNGSKQKEISRVIAIAKKSIYKGYSTKYSLDYMTLEHHAATTKKKFLIALCMQDINGRHIYQEEDFLTADSTVLEKAIEFLESEMVSVEDFRELARTEPWRTMWNLGKERCFDTTSVADWTDDQRILVTFAKMYDNAYQSTDCPSDTVFENDDMFDGWMIDQRRKRETDQKQKQVDTLNKIPDSAQEVFVFAPTKEDAEKIYDLNDATARQKIQQRQKTIARLGEVEAQHLPDTQMELRNQQMEEYKNKMRRGS